MNKVVSINARSAATKTPRSSFLFCKRLADVVLAAVMLVVLMPLLLVVTLVAAYDTAGSPFFVQTRMGKNGKTFRMIKFRTMSKSAPENLATYEFKNANDFISPIGHVLRKFSLDELPQLWNVLKGDMSFVGPRPVVLTEEELLSLRELHGALEVRPGITGFAQVRGRDELPIVQKAFLDGYYARHATVLMDLKILWRTALYVLRAEGVRDSGEQRTRSSQTA